MARFPGAIWNPIDVSRLSGLPMAAYNRVNLHVAVSEASSLRDYFNGTNKPSSHFYVRKNGTVEQYVDTGLRAEADLDGNDATISIETQGGVTNANAEPWTDAQLDTLARIYAWAVQAHGIAVRLATDSRVGDSSKGLSWHRLGIDPWRVPNGMRYSTSAGKVCPGDAKIAQIPAILTRAQRLLGAPTAAAAQAAHLPEEDDMLLIQDTQTKKIYTTDGHGAAWVSDLDTVKALSGAGIKGPIQVGPGYVSELLANK